MGDRENPIKFGPEWLRNMSRERSDARINSRNSPGGPPGGASGSTGPPGGPTSTANAAPTSSSTNTSKIHLAKLRYGREEMLALYDRNAEAPPELKYIETLYQPRGKQPVALNNTFEDDIRDSLRGAPPMGGMTGADRFGMGRGGGRGITTEGRGRPRGSYVHRPLTSGRGAMWHVSNPRMPGYSGGPDDEGGAVRPWNNNNLNNASNRNSGDQTDWATKMFRNKRQGHNTNWRSPQTRDEGEEWRSSEHGRNRQLEKWDFRDWGERPSGEKNQSWSSNRRTWVGGDSQAEENLPEWAAESAECGGTFDSSGAFHGYSNDDTNLPKHHQDSTYPLTRSHTHGSFPRPKAVEEGSEEWWASEKAKKLSPKRFDASEIKFKKQSGSGNAEGQTSQNASNKANTSAEELAPPATPDKPEPQPETPEPPESNTSAQNEDKYNNKNKYKSKYGESKTFEALMRSDINMEEASDERGNFQSVIIAANNGLRQKHQHLVPANENINKTLQNLKLGKNIKSELDHGPHKTPEDLLVDNIFGMTMDDKEILSSSSGNSLMNRAGLGSQKQNLNMPMGLSNAGMPNHVMPRELMGNQNLQAGGMQQGHPSQGMQPDALQSPNIQQGGMQPGMSGGMQSSMMQSGNYGSGLPTHHPSGGLQSTGMQQIGLQSPRMPNVMLQDPRLQTPGMQPVMQQVGITNSALNASLGLPIGPNPNIGLPMQGLPPQVMPNVCMANNMAASMGASGMMGTASMQGPGNHPTFQSAGGIPGMPNNIGNSSLFLGQNSNNPSMSSNDMPMPNHAGQSNMFPMHGMQQPGSQQSFGNSIYSNNTANLADQWYYEDPDRNIQGPFSSKDMYSWHRAGFFSPSLMVRRACENIMRPLGTYGPVVPFAQMEMMQSFPISGGFESRPQGHENMLNQQSTLALDVMNINNMNMSDKQPMMDTLQFGSVRLMANPPFIHPPPMVDSLWGQPTSNDRMWMQQSMAENRAGVNNLSMFFWEQPPSAIASNALRPEDITKEMKTEDQILAQLRASQNMGPPPMAFINDQKVAAPMPGTKPDDRYPATNATPNLEELHKLIQKDTLTGNVLAEPENLETQQKNEKPSKLNHSSSDTSITKTQPKVVVENKASKQIKENEKTAKNKENATKKNKKAKEEKKDDNVDIKTKEDEVIKAEKRSQEPSPSKNKKEEKSKKESEREKKEWIKDGFTIVKGSEKNATKDNKKKAEEARAAEEAERKRKDEEKMAFEEDKKRKHFELSKKQQPQELQHLVQRQASEFVVKKAPWSAVANQTMQAINRDGLTLAEIQRLEREKKLEQMKEQQQMMQIIAQQQAAALAREQEMQAGLGWAKKKGNSVQTHGQSLAEIQAEARRQAAAAAAASQAQALEEAQANAPPPTNNVPWGNAQNGVMGGFWDTQLQMNQPSMQEKVQEQPKPELKKKKPTLVIPPKKETSPVVEFETWCTVTLSSWSSKIDVPTFVGFLKDIESPYEVKDYVKCYLGDSRETNDFARQFLERRSKLLRVGMVTPSDDLCSPAIAVNPRTNSGSDYQEVKGKGKKTKKNKMLKVDARILGFSVTASEDRINVGDIDTV